MQSTLHTLANIGISKHHTTNNAPKTHNSFLGHHFCFVLILFLLHVIMLVHQYFLAVRVIKGILQIS